MSAWAVARSQPQPEASTHLAGCLATTKVHTVASGHDRPLPVRAVPTLYLSGASERAHGHLRTTPVRPAAKFSRRQRCRLGCARSFNRRSQAAAPPVFPKTDRYGRHSHPDRRIVAAGVCRDGLRHLLRLRPRSIGPISARAAGPLGGVAILQASATRPRRPRNCIWRGAELNRFGNKDNTAVDQGYRKCALGVALPTLC